MMTIDGKTGLSDLCFSSIDGKTGLSDLCFSAYARKTLEGEANSQATSNHLGFVVKRN
jgi:hypothetical protein